MKQIHITYCGMDASGRTVADAKQNAARKIEAALAGSYCPTMLRAGDMLAFVWREPNGYCYRIIYADSGTGPVYGNYLGIMDERECLRKAAHHLAQNAGSYAGLERYLDRRDISELNRYFAWQSNYARARAAGYDDEAARAMATQGTVIV